MSPQPPEKPASGAFDDGSIVDETSPTFIETPADLRSGPVVSIAGYTQLRPLHQGGQGVVYEALQESTKRTVAIKVLTGGTYASVAARRRFQREVEIVARLRHQNIVSIFDSGQTPDGQLYFVMEFIAGQQLDRHVRENKLSLDRMLRLFLQVLEAVQFAHENGVIHRDLKPSNILVDQDGQAKVVDFGLARPLLGGADSVASVTGQVMGTFAYMSPEQVRGRSEGIDVRTDIYSLGMVLYEICTGKSPYPVDSQIVEVLHHITDTPPRSPVKAWDSATGIFIESVTGRRGEPKCPIDGNLETIILRTIAKDPQRRYATVEAFSADLRNYLEGGQISAKRDTRVYLAKKKIHRHRNIVVPAVTALVVVVLALLFIPRGMPERAPIDQESRLKFLEGETEYAEVRQELMSVLSQQEASGEPADAVAGESLRIVQDAVRELKTALEDDPGNEGLQSLLLKNYQREIRLMRKMCELPGDL